MSDEVQTHESQTAASPASVLDQLRAGNARFVAGEATARDLLAQAAATADGQHPIAAILGCIDSRVPVEAVFDQGIGDVFVGRTAGNVVDADVLGGFEFATALAGAKAIVVLGHTACGAVKGACEGAELGNLTQLLAKITPAVEAVSGELAPGSADADLVGRVVEQNVRNSVATLAASDVLAAREAAGELVIVGAVYELATGVVTWLDAD